MPQSPSPTRRQRRRRTHNRTDSNHELLSSYDQPISPSPRRQSQQPRSSPRHQRREREEIEREVVYTSPSSPDSDAEDVRLYQRREDRRRRRESSSREVVDGEGSPSKARPKPERRREESRRDVESGRRRDRERERKRERDRGERGDRGTRRRREAGDGESRSSGTVLSAEQLARLDRMNEGMGLRGGGNEGEKRRDRDDDRRRDRERLRREEEDARDREERRRERREQRRRQREEERLTSERVIEVERRRELDTRSEVESAAEDKRRRRRKRESREERRVASGQVLERGGETYYNEKEEYYDDIRPRDGSNSSLYDPDAAARRTKRWRNILIGVAVLLVLLIIIIPVAIVVSRRHKSSGSSSSSSSGLPNSNLNGTSESSIPQQYQGTYLDPFTWYDTLDFNVTFTAQMVGNLSVMGLNSTWDDSAQANSNVPALNQAWSYGKMPIRGVNLGGWLSIEPFITPSLFSSYTSHDNVVDEYTLCQKLGSSAQSTIEKHYSQWVQESTFAEIQAAGFDHIRIPFSYWAVVTYSGDPYVPNVSWRYLLRGIEWARKYGLRINLDLHGAPGSQNGWNHSGRQGLIGWLNGTDGDLNAQRTTQIHNQLSTFFTQPRYKNIITIYGLVNEPRMVSLDTNAVLSWSQTTINTIRANNYTGIIAFGDGFLGLPNWKGKLQGISNLLLDVHQYVIFNVDQIVLNHHDKINFACGGWTQQTLQSSDTSTGFGPTLCGEWSQADTDCTTYLNNVGVGTRWQGTLNMASTPGGSTTGSVLTPTCPTDNNPQCSCDGANASPSAYSSLYKQWLLMFAEAQMHSFEQGWGWFYWTWQTESAPQWSYKDGLAAGILPQQTFSRNFSCDSTIPDFAALGLPETY